IVLENDEWYYYSQEMGIFPFVRREEYMLYMVEHATDCFPACTETFQELNRLFSAPEKEEFFEAGRKGVRFLRDTYLERVPWLNGYAIRERHAQDRSFLRVLLELGLVVRRDCESGQRYVETAEVDAHTSAQPGSGDPE
ncbi:MAG: hypothetical protein LUQ69_02865, partial [Methanoregulaceae archaeon]|nr:hypothetical protein [Methanoregulaceae archaeon]